jgi:hypothetical protein
MIASDNMVATIHKIIADLPERLRHLVGAV